jgi:hypothetical protein
MRALSLIDRSLENFIYTVFAINTFFISHLIERDILFSFLMTFMSDKRIIVRPSQGRREVAAHEN